MAATFRNGVEVTVAVFADTPTSSWDAMRAAGLSPGVLGDLIVSALIAVCGATVTAAPVEVTPRTGADATLAARVTFRPGRDVGRVELDDAIVRWLNQPAPAGHRWTPHTSANAYAAGGASAAVAAPLVALVGLPLLVVGLVSSDARTAAREQWLRVAGVVIDESSIRLGSSREPVGASSSAIGRAATVATGGSVSSTDPTRDGQTPAARAASEVPGVQPPAWLLPVVIVGASILGVAVVGYGARGIAQVMRES